MKVKRNDTEDARRYWRLMDENSKVVASWPEWKRGARPATPDETTGPGPERTTCRIK